MKSHLTPIQFPKIKMTEDLKDSPENINEWETFIKENLAQYNSCETEELKRYYCGNLGVAYRVINKLEDAEFYLQIAVGLSAKESPSKQIQNWIRLAHVYQWQKKFEKSKTYFDLAKSAIDEFDISELLRAFYHQHLGKFYFDQNDFEMALTEFEIALEIRNRIFSPEDQIESTLQAIAVTKKRLS